MLQGQGAVYRVPQNVRLPEASQIFTLAGCFNIC